MYEQVLNFVSFEGNKRKVSIILMVLAFVVYANTLGHGYVQDDMAVITHNRYVQQGIEGLGKIFTTPSLSGFTERQIVPGEAVNDIYRPISLALFALEHQLFGADPQVGHLVSVLLFVLCTLFVFRFLSVLFGGNNATAAFAGTLIFVVHPIHTEVVANIKSNDELLSVSAGLGAMLLFIRFVNTGKTLYAVVGMGALFFSLLCKETTASFIAVIPLTALFLHRAERKRVVIVAALCAASFAGYMLLRTSVLNAHNANHPDLIGFMENPLVAPAQGTSAAATAISVLGRYLLLLFVPYPLAADRTFASLPFVGWGAPIVWATVFVYVAVVVFAVRGLVKNGMDRQAYAVLFFLFTIAIFSNLVFLTGSIMADRFLFLPSVALSILVGVFLSRGGKQSGIIYTAFTVALLLFAGMTVARNAGWKDNYTLCTADLEHYPNNARLHHTAAYLIVNEKMPEATTNEEKGELARQAIEHYRNSLNIYPKQGKVCTDLAGLFQGMQQYDSARIYMEKALALQPGNPTILSMLGGVYFVQGQYQQTLGLCHVALSRLPSDIALLSNITMCHMQLKAFDSVKFYCSRILAIDTSNAFAMGNLEAIKGMVNIPAASTDSARMDGR
jgi:protein O-mannosyl-transferase